MKNLVNFLLLFVLLSAPVPGYSLSEKDNEKAMELFFSAEDNYSQGRYGNAVKSLDKAVKILGSSNIKIQSLLIFSLHKSNTYSAFERAGAEIDAYISMKPAQDDVYADIMKIRMDVQRKLAAEQRAATSAASEKHYKAYLAEYPNGRYGKEITAKLNALYGQKEKELYETAVSDGTGTAYSNYLNTYPDGKYAIRIRELLARHEDDQAYSAAVKSSEAAKYQEYLTNYPNGAHAGEARSVLERAGKIEAERQRVFTVVKESLSCEIAKSQVDVLSSVTLDTWGAKDTYNSAKSYLKDHCSK